MTGIMDNFELPNDEEDEFMFKFSEGDNGNNIRQDIWEIIKTYEEVCRERETVLLNIYSDFDDEDEIQAHAATDVDVENYLEDSDEIDQTVSTLDNRAQKLKIQTTNKCKHQNKLLHDKLVRLFREGRQSSKNKGEIEGQLRELKLQKNVVGQFKKLQANKEDRKEKLNTWKYAATEIVDLLQSVRKEGATDIERLETEFTKLLAAFKAQTELADKFEEKLEKQKIIVKQTEELKQKANRETISLQDEYDRSRAKLKTVEIKCLNLETQLKQAQVSKESQNSPEEAQAKITLQTEIDKLESDVKMYKDLCEKEKLEKERLEKAIANKPSLPQAVDTKDEYKERPVSPEVIKQIIQECEDCKHTKARIDELGEQEVQNQKEIERLTLQLEELTKATEEDKIESKTNDDKESTSSKSKKNKSDKNNQEDTLKLPKMSRGEKRGSKMQLKKSKSNVGIADVTPVPSREIITEVKIIEKVVIEKVVKISKSTQADIAPEIKYVDKSRHESRGSRRGAESRHSIEDSQPENGGNLNGLGSIVDQEFSSIARKILGYVKVVGNIGMDDDHNGGHDGDHDDMTASQTSGSQGLADIFQQASRPTSQKQPIRPNGTPYTEVNNNLDSTIQNGQFENDQTIRGNRNNGVSNSNPDDEMRTENISRMDSEKNMNMKRKEKTVHSNRQTTEDSYQTLQDSDHKMQDGDQAMPSSGQTMKRSGQTMKDSDQTITGSVQTMQRSGQTMQRNSQAMHDGDGKTIQDGGMAIQYGGKTSQGGGKEVQGGENISNPYPDSNDEDRKIFDPETKTWVSAKMAEESTRRASQSQNLRHESRRYSTATKNSMAFKQENVTSDIQCSWEESGFFDEEKLISPEHTTAYENEPKKHWDLLKTSGKARQVLRFLTSISHKQCSHLSERVNIINPKGQIEQNIASKLRVYASHAVDLLDIISFAVKKLDLKQKANHEDTQDSLMATLKEHWKPVDASMKSGLDPSKAVLNQRRGSILPARAMSNTRNDSFVPMMQHQPHRHSVKLTESPLRDRRRSVLPGSILEKYEAPHTFLKPTEEVSRREPSPVDQLSPQISQTTEEEKERLAKIAEKKRLKILERHKKLVDRLRAGGASTKQIYAILGISKKGEEVDTDEGTDRTHRRKTVMTSSVESEEEKTFSIVGNGVRQRRLGFTSDMHNRNGVMNFNQQALVMNSRMMNMNNQHGMMNMNREGMSDRNGMMGINTTGIGHRDAPRMAGFHQQMNNSVIPGQQQQRGFNANRLGNRRHNNQQLFPNINNKNIAPSMGVASTPLNSLNFFNTKPINNLRR